MINVTGEGVDYDSGPYSIIVFAGMTSVPFSISINNDMMFEDNETIMLSIHSNLSYDIIVGDPGEAIVTIVNDDSKYHLVH